MPSPSFDINGSEEFLDGIGQSLRRFGGSRKLLQKVLDTIPQTVFWKDKDLNYLGCNQLFAQLAGKGSPADLIGLSDFDLPWGPEETEFYRMCDRRVMESNQAEIGIVESQINAEGKLTWLETNKVPLHNDQGEVIGVLGTFHDITRLKKAEEILQRTNEELERRVEERTKELTFVANHDGLTGLANRSYFVEQLNDILDSEQNEKIGLMFIDLDNFKPVNDSDGHDAGDRLLIQVGAVLCSASGSCDVVGRFGGDEFLVLLRDVDSRSSVSRVCEDIRRRLSTKIQIGGRLVPVTASIGIVVCETGDYQNSDDLLNDTDLAMYAAKSQGKNGHSFFVESMRDSAELELNLRKQVVSGINNGQFVLHYQPIVDMARGRIHSFEALVRWQHPDRGLVFPDEFILLAESSGLIVQLGHQIIDMACQQLAEWRNELGTLAGDLKVSVNLSSRQLIEPGFVESLQAVTMQYGVQPRWLNLEITESYLLKDGEAAVSVLRRLRDIGFRLHLDDFGTGYSSLNYLDEMPVDTLKIDRTFVDKFETDRGDNAIVRMILALAETLQMDVIAEGVENALQAEVLKAMNCNLLQGYFFAKPMAADLATEYIRNHQAPDAFEIEFIQINST